jgi:hypothetical protein
MNNSAPSGRVSEQTEIKVAAITGELDPSRQRLKLLPNRLIDVNNHDLSALPRSNSPPESSLLLIAPYSLTKFSNLKPGKGVVLSTCLAL